MATQNITRRCIPFALALLTITGCFGNAPPKPLTNKVLSLVARGRFGFASLDVENDSGSRVFDIPESPARDLLKSLMPFVQIQLDELPEKPDFGFTYQSGNAPLSFDVVVMEKALIFRQVDFTRTGQEVHWFYQGGDAGKFQRIVDEIVGTGPKDGIRQGKE